MTGKRLSQSDEALAQDAYLQWWYFDAIFEDGLRLLTFVLPRNSETLETYPPGQPFLDIVLRTPSGDVLRERRSFSPKEFSPCKNAFGATLGGDCSLGFEGRSGSNSLGRYLLKARAGRLAYDLRLIPEVPPWSPNGPSGFLPRPALMLARRSLFTKDYFHYAVFVPRGKLEGQILVDGKPLNVLGSGYHEQGRVSFPLREFAKTWYWLHVERPPWTILSGTIVPLHAFPRFRTGSQGGFAFVQKDDRQLLGASDPFGVAVRWTRLVHHPDRPRSEAVLAWKAHVTCLRPGLMVKADIASREVLEHVHFQDPDKIPTPSHWGQTIADAKVKIFHGFRRVEFDAECVLETMVTGA